LIQGLLNLTVDALELRLIDNHFQPEELLYLRLFDCPSLVGTAPSGVSVNFPVLSVNRSKYSEPDDLLNYRHPKYAQCGVAQFRVDAIPPPMVPSTGGKQVHWEVVHVPEADNYSHSEVQSFKEGKPVTGNTISSEIKKAFRQALAEKMTVVIACRLQ